MSIVKEKRFIIMNYKKTLTIIPSAFIALVALAGCNNDNTTSGGGQAKSALSDFVNSLSDGEHTEEEISGLFAEGVLASNDASIKSSGVQYLNYLPLNWVNPGYEEYVELTNNIQTFKSYDNDVVVTAIDYTNYPYDKNSTSKDGLAKDPITYKGKAQIYKDGEDIRYTYTQDDDPENAYSFTYAKAVSDNKFKEFTEGGGISDVLVGAIDLANQYVNLYDGQIEDSSKVSKNFTATKSGTKLTVDYKFAYDALTYSLERTWGYTHGLDEDNPGTKYTTNYDGYYMNISMVVSYDYVIENGFITDATVVETAYYYTIMVDQNWKEGDPTPAYDLTDEYIAKLDLKVAEKVWYEDEDTGKWTQIDNPYNGKQFSTTTPFEVYYLASSGESLGNYKSANLPDASKYRTADSTDQGCWFDVQDLIEYDE